MPILGLLTGARLEAIGRLRLSDFREYEPGRWSIRFDPRFDKCGREREIPIHPLLIEIGFIHYLTDITSLEFEEDWLFPGLTEIDTRRTHYTSKRFGELRKALGIDDGSDFHAFRRTVVSCLAKNGCDGYIRRAFVGHEEGDPNDVHEINYAKPEYGPAALALSVFKALDYEKSDGFSWPGWSYQPGSLTQTIRRRRA